jgi:APA family basic amino acid/polyamine antiporter
LSSNQERSSEPRLKRSLNLLDATSIGLGAIIGAGIFVVIGVATGIAGPGVVISVIIAGVSATFTAFSFAELGAAIPKAGGVYEYGHEMISHSVGFLMGLLWVAGNILLGATASLGFGNYFSSVFTFVPAKLAALGIIAFVVLVNTIGIKQSALLNDLLVIAKVGVLILFILVGLPKIQLSNFSTLYPHGLFAVIQAAALFYFAYIGFPRIATTAEEVKEPQKTIPRAILAALSISILIYIFTSVTAVGLIGYEKLGSSPTPIADAANAIGLMDIVEVGALLATFSVILTSVMGQSRVMFAMARNEELPSFLSQISSRFDTPIFSIILSGLMMAVLAFGLDLSGLASLGSFCVLTTHVLANYSAFRLFRGTPENELRFKAPLRPVHAVAGALLSLILITGLPLDTIAIGLLFFVVCFAWFALYTRVLMKAG